MTSPTSEEECLRMNCPYGHIDTGDGIVCGKECFRCGDAFCEWKDSYEIWIDKEYYCEYCMSAVVKENSKTMTLEDMCDRWNDNGYIYMWLYGYSVDNAVTTIGNWWFIQRKKMFRKPTKSAQKK